MTPRCNRCDFKQTDETSLAEHAADAYHPLCLVCPRSLRQSETVVCMRCVAQLRVDLAEIEASYLLLPLELQHHADEQIPGGAAIVMLAPGSPGSLAGGQPHAHDASDADPESIAHTLSQWEDDWRRALNHSAAPGAPSVAAAAGYLSFRVSWAADNHPAFPDFVTDVRRLLARLQVVTATGLWPLRAPVRCFDCGQGRLTREYDDAAPCGCPPRPVLVQWVLQPCGCREPVASARRRHAVALTSWEQAHRRRHSRGGLADDWTCGSCDRVYTQEAYWLALRAKLEEATV